MTRMDVPMTQSYGDAEMKTWTKEEIRERLATDDNWLIRGILALFRLQTGTEQSRETTEVHNDVGFGAADATILSSFAKQIISHTAHPKYPTPLSPKQLAISRRKMAKYSNQLSKIANGKIPQHQGD